MIISPDEMNKFISTVIIAPMTTKGRDYPTRVKCVFDAKDGQIVLDQIRTVDKVRLHKKLGTINRNAQSKVLEVLQEIFAE